MPIVYRCKGCGFILYDSRNPERYGITKSFGIPTPSEVASWYGGVCPRCGRKLNTKPDPLKDVEIAGRVIRR